MDRKTVGLGTTKKEFLIQFVPGFLIVVVQANVSQKSVPVTWGKYG